MLQHAHRWSSRSCRRLLRTIGLGSLAACLNSFFAPTVWPETVELTTYYPAPFGVYDTLVAEKFVDYNAGAYNVPPIASDWFVDPSAGGNPASVSATLRGRVGIGTANPSVTNAFALLALYKPTGHNYLTITTAAGYQSAIGFGDLTNGQDMTLYRPANTRDLRLWAYGFGDVITFRNSNGNVGIGTVSPSALLHVAGNPAASVRLQDTAGPANSKFFDIIADGGTLRFRALNDNQTNKGTTERMLIDANGNVGIRADGPVTTLDIGADQNTSATLTVRNQNNVQNAGGAIYFSAYGSQANHSGARIRASLDFAQGLNSQVRLILSSYWSGFKDELALVAGNVGVGTKSPQARLDVTGDGTNNGTIRFGETAATGGLLYATDGSDYAPTGKRLFLAVRDGAGNANDEISIGPNTGGIAGHVNVMAQDIQLVTSGTGYLRLVNDKLGINQSPIGGHTLQVNGAVCASNLDNCASDARFKENVQPLTGVLEKLDSMRGVSFRWNALSKDWGGHPGQQDIGIIAQEVESVFPELVTPIHEGSNYRLVHYGRLTAVLLEAIKELEAKSAAELQELKSQHAQEIHALQQRIEALEHPAEPSSP